MTRVPPARATFAKPREDNDIEPNPALDGDEARGLRTLRDALVMDAAYAFVLATLLFALHAFYVVFSYPIAVRQTAVTAAVRSRHTTSVNSS